MNKTKKTKAFNISLTFGVLVLLFACIFASFFVYTPNVLAYVDSSVECSVVSINKNYKGNGFFDESIQYGIRYPSGIDTPVITYCINYTFYESLEFDSFLFSICNYYGLFDYMIDYGVSGFGLLVQISSSVDEDTWYQYSFGDMIALERPDNEMFTYINYYEGNDLYGAGTYLINFNSSQEISGEGMLTIYVNIATTMDSTHWTSFKNYNTYERYKNCFGIQILESGVINPDGSFSQGYEVGYNNGVSLSNQISYDNGYTAGLEAGGNIGSWLAGVGEAPLTLIKSLFNIEIFGINLNTIVFSLLGALVVIKLIRLFI